MRSHVMPMCINSGLLRGVVWVQMAYRCSLCAKFESIKLSALVVHIRIVHADDPNFGIQCTFEGCCRTFRKFPLYRNHLYMYHSNLFKSPSEYSSMPPSQSSQESDLVDHSDSYDSDRVYFSDSGSSDSDTDCETKECPEAITGNEAQHSIEVRLCKISLS